MKLYLYSKVLDESPMWVLFDSSPNSLLQVSWLLANDVSTNKSVIAFRALIEAIHYLTGVGVADIELLISDKNVYNWVNRVTENRQYITLLSEYEDAIECVRNISVNYIPCAKNYARQYATTDAFLRQQDKRLVSLDFE